MLIITMEVDAPAGQAIGIKESIAMDLEKYGDVRVVSVEERKPVQTDMWGENKNGTIDNAKFGRERFSADGYNR